MFNIKSNFSLQLRLQHKRQRHVCFPPRVSFPLPLYSVTLLQKQSDTLQKRRTFCFHCANCLKMPINVFTCRHPEFRQCRRRLLCQHTKSGQPASLLLFCPRKLRRFAVSRRLPPVRPSGPTCCSSVVSKSPTPQYNWCATLFFMEVLVLLSTAKPQHLFQSRKTKPCVWLRESCSVLIVKNEFCVLSNNCFTRSL